MMINGDRVEFHNDAERDEYVRQHEQIRADACINVNKRLAKIFEQINPKWSDRAVFVSPITTSVLYDYKEQWSVNQDFPLNLDPKNDVHADSRFNWFQNVRFSEEVASQFNVAVYSGKNLIALGMGGHKNWHVEKHGDDIKTNIVGIDAVEVVCGAGNAEPGLALIAIAETARSFAHATGRDTLGLVWPSDQVKVLLDRVEFPKSTRGEYVMKIENLDFIWKNLKDILHGKNRKISGVKSIEVADITSKKGLTCEVQ